MALSVVSAPVTLCSFIVLLLKYKAYDSSDGYRML
jgi:hypothetical protein